MRAFPILLILFTQTLAWAGEDDSFTNYDTIVNELKSSADTPVRPPAPGEELNWDEVAPQGGLGLAATLINYAGPRGISGQGLLKGFEAHVGFNLFTKVARVEAAFRNFGQDTISHATSADMRELEARLIFLPHVYEKTVLRMGGGLAGRFLSIHSPNGAFTENTPFYSLLLGFERKFTNNLSIGPEISHHAALDAAAADKSSWDAEVRLNATF